MAILYRTSKPKEPQGNIAHCQWCGVPLDPSDFLWLCQAESGNCYLVCDGCHEEARDTA